MAFSFDDLREKVTDLAQSGVAKSKQLAEIAKLKTSNMGEEDTIKKAYLELGRLYYAERGAAVWRRRQRASPLSRWWRMSPPRSPPRSRRSRRPRQRRPLPPRRRLPPRRSPSRTYDPIGQRPGQLLSGPFPHRNGAGGGHCGRRRMTMKQYFRRPQDVVGEDRVLLTYWNTMSGKVQLRLLESGLSVSTLGELKMLQEQIEHEG